MEASIRLAIFGTNTLFRECLTVVLRGDQRYVVVESTDFQSAAPGLSPSPEVVLVDFSRSRDAALQLVLRLTRQAAVQVLCVGIEHVEEDSLRCMEAGAKGYVPISSSMADLHDAIARVRRGEVAFAPEITPAMFEHLAELSNDRQRQTQANADSLTARETEVLLLVGRGLTNREIGEKLSLSTHTVKNHVHHILKKLQVRTRREAVRLALRQGLIGRHARRTSRTTLNGKGGRFRLDPF